MLAFPVIYWASICQPSDLFYNLGFLAASEPGNWAPTDCRHGNLEATEVEGFVNKQALFVEAFGRSEIFCSGEERVK